MNFSASTISGTVLTAATSLGAMASAHAQALGTTVATTVPRVVETAVSGAPTAARNLALVERPISVAANTARVGPLMRFASGLSRVLPWVAIGVSTASGAQAVQAGGAGALVNTKDGRGAVLGALGGGLLLIPTPVTHFGAAVVLAGVAANEFGGLRFLDRRSIAPTS